MKRWTESVLPERPVSLSFAYEFLQSRVDEGKSCKCCLVHGVDEVLVCVGEARFLIQELSVEVAAVIGGFLWVEDRDIS